MATSGPITRSAWAKLRRDAELAFPEQLAGKPLPEVLLPYQQRLLETTATHEVIFVEKSRRTG